MMQALPRSSQPLSIIYLCIHIFISMLNNNEFCVKSSFVIIYSYIYDGSLFNNYTMEFYDEQLRYAIMYLYSGNRYSILIYGL